MGLRFRRSFRVLPGVRVNVAKRGVSVSVGGRGLTTNFSKHGRRTTIGLHGSGISYSTYKPYSPGQRPTGTNNSSWLGGTALVIVMLALAAIAFSAFVR
jgi:hypothetical protein